MGLYCIAFILGTYILSTDATPPDPMIRLKSLVLTRGLQEYSDEKFHNGKCHEPVNEMFSKVTFRKYKDESLGTCALKTISKQRFPHNNELYFAGLEFGLTEIEVLKRLKGVPYIVKFRGAYRDKTGEELMIELEYLNNERLLDLHYSKLRSGISQYKYNGHPFGIDSFICKNIARIAVALAYMKRKHVVHRDLTLESIKYDESGYYTIANFELSTVLNKNNKIKYACGTMYALAPEILDGMEYSFPVDVWSLGILLWTIYYPDSETQDGGPFDHRCGPNCPEDHRDKFVVMKIIRENMGKKLPLPTEKFKSSHLCELLKKMLTVNPDERITIEEVLEHQWFEDNGEGAKQVITEFKKKQTQRIEEMNIAESQNASFTLEQIPDQPNPPLTKREKFFKFINDVIYCPCVGLC